VNRVVGGVLAGVVLTGCASIVRGPDQQVSLASQPAGARLVITDMRENKDIHVGTTPFTATLKRGAGYFKKAMYKVTVEQPGYRKEEVTVEGRPGGWYIGGNVLFGGLIGWLVVDPATGAMWTLDPEDVNVTLTRGAAGMEPTEGLRVVLIDDVPAGFLTKLRAVTRVEAR
jgi:hypothetical protein